MSASKDFIRFLKTFYFLIVLSIDAHAASRDTLSLHAEFPIESSRLHIDGMTIAAANFCRPIADGRNSAGAMLDARPSERSVVALDPEPKVPTCTEPWSRKMLQGVSLLQRGGRFVL